MPLQRNAQVIWENSTKIEEFKKYLNSILPINNQQNIVAVLKQFAFVIEGCLLDGLGHKCLETRPDFPGRQVPTGRDEFHPQGHGPFASIAQF